MKRRIVAILLFLLAGAVMNVMVAWGCAALNPERVSEVPPLQTTQKEWARLAPPALQDRRIWARHDRAIGWEFIVIGTDWDKPVRWRDNRTLIIDELQCFLTRAGWPTRCLEGWFLVSVRNTADSQSDVTGTRTDHSILYPPARIDGFEMCCPCFPLRPIWPGFALNTIFYAALFWLGLRGPFALRRYLRRQRGRCLNCGYDLRGDLAAGCPECGWGRIDAQSGDCDD